MKKHSSYITILILFIVLISSCTKHVIIRPEKGVVNISRSDLKLNKIIKLNGEWEFYYGKLLSPSDFIKDKNKLKKEFIKVPQSWTIKENGKKYPEQGFATYRLIITTDDTITSVRFDNKRIFSASKIWLNGKLISEIGKTSTKETIHEPDLKLFFSKPVTLKKRNELIIQVSNFSDWRAGIIASVNIGEEKAFSKEKKIELISIVTILSIILIIGLYHFSLFLYRKTELSNLIFSSLAFLFFIIGIVGNDTLLKNIVNPNFYLITRLFHLGVSIYPALITIFFYLLFHKEVNKRLVIITIIFSSLLLIFSLSFDIYWVRRYITIKIIYIFVISAYFTFYSLPKAIINKRRGAIWAFSGMIFLFISNINDILFSLDIIRTGYIAIYGFAAYVLLQSLNIAERFSFNFNKIKKLTKKLRYQNKEYLILNKQYKKQNKELIIAKEHAEKADKLKSAFLANMSHEIRTPMNAIVGFSNLLYNNNYSEEKAKQIISYIINGSNTLLHLIDDIIDISKIEANQLEIHTSKFPINTLFKNLTVIYNEKRKTESSDVELKFIKNNNTNIFLFSDKIRLQQVFINLIDNALKFTEKGYIEVSYKANSNVNLITFMVKDTGIGLTTEQQKNIFNRFTKLENKGDKLYRGAGLGLSICKNIIKLLNGKIWVESEINTGTTFYFSIPLK